ncbi:cobyrinate a,c-diamide synthase [Nocardioides marmorisolisilvae]|uniref:cobyrinate a,c-diamide synthase n=1 Tax=Nocardioides marmorisolisilvae TaxID=1542737 RepID=UPI0026CA2B0F
MTTYLPRLVIAAPASGHGKTTVATGLMAALSRAGHTVSGHKVGPDYIDPGYHALATGRPGRNLDPHLVGEDRLVPLLLHGAAGADLAVIEGVMGLYDGQLGTDGFSSTAHVAAVTKTPVVLVVDISHASRSIAATVHGLRTWSDEVAVVGVVLNKAGSVRHSDEVVRALAGSGLPVLGILQRDDGVSAPSRHLGLVPAAERADAAAALDLLAAQVAERIDLEAIVRLARTAPALDGEPWSPDSSLVAPVETPRPVIAVAGGRAFTFAYAETTELLRAAGCDPVVFDPTTDEQLPDGTQGLYLGGGFPEVHAAELSGNERLRAQLRTAISGGLPTVAECAGLLYLCRSVDGVEMVGAVPADAAMAPRLTLAYRTATATTANLLGRPGETVTGHEFHRTQLHASPGDPAWSFGNGLVDGVATATLHASYLHTHWAGHPQLAGRFVEAVRRATPAAPSTDPGRLSLSKPAEPVDPLRHHGDREATAGLIDFAVNVYQGPRPDWLENALAGADVSRYPDPRPAAEAVARHHGRDVADVLPTAGAAEAFGLVARLRPWRRPVIVHPQFTEPDVALAGAGHQPEHVLLRPSDGFALDPAQVPVGADLVVIGNPTNPTGVRHSAEAIRALVAPGRLVVVDEAFLDDGAETLTTGDLTGLVVIRSLTKLWSIPGVRAGYLLAEPEVVGALTELQTPWSVSAAAGAALVACSSEDAAVEATVRVARIEADREFLLSGLAKLGIPHVAGSSAPYVLARPGTGVHAALRDAGYAVRRADTFPGLDESWVRIAVRNREVTTGLLDALECIHQARGSRWDSGTVALL